jgi:hypothetical protein
MDYRAIVESAGGKFISMQGNVIFFAPKGGGRILTVYCGACTPENIGLALKNVLESEPPGFAPLERCD